MGNFKIHSKFKPMGDQPVAIESLVSGLNKNEKFQTLLGVTGSGKTYTMANIIEKVQKPTIVLAHNKTLAAQLCSEFKEFFPNNIVEYFVSYYDYYQPEAYVPQTDTFIEKDASINDEIDKLRHSATSALFERRDVIIVASVSCIYGLGNPDEYKKLTISLRVGMEKERDEIIKKLIEIQYERNDINFVRNKFRVRGDVVEIFPSNNGENAIRVEFFGDEIERICEVNVVTGEIVGVRLCDRRAGIGCDILYRSRFAGRCRHDNGIIHCIILFQGRNDLCNCRGLLSDCDINTNDILSFLVNDRIHSDRCLTGLTVADDQFTLTASDGEHRVNGKDTGL